jgi:hypothetical protein
MRLECQHHAPPRVALADGIERRRDLGGVMPVVVDDGDRVATGGSLTSATCVSLRSMPWKFASARWMASCEMPISSATAMAASEFSTLCTPGRLMVTGKCSPSARRTTSKWVFNPSRRRFSACRSAPGEKP